MTTTPTPPVVPPEDPNGGDRSADPVADSAEADRRASQDGDTAIEDQTADPEPDSADADYAASMGDRPETD
jgi:hypothetical protein